MGDEAEPTNPQGADGKARKKGRKAARTRKDPGRELKCDISTKTRLKLAVLATQQRRSLGTLVEEALKPYLAHVEVRIGAESGDEENENS